MAVLQQFFMASDWIYNTIREARLAQQAYNELSNLSDRELRDLGISRSEIIAIAFGTKQY